MSKDNDIRLDAALMDEPRSDEKRAEDENEIPVQRAGGATATTTTTTTHASLPAASDHQLLGAASRLHAVIDDHRPMTPITAAIEAMEHAHPTHTAMLDLEDEDVLEPKSSAVSPHTPVGDRSHLVKSVENCIELQIHTIQKVEEVRATRSCCVANKKRADGALHLAIRFFILALLRPLPSRSTRSPVCKSCARVR